MRWTADEYEFRPMKFGDMCKLLQLENDPGFVPIDFSSDEAFQASVQKALASDVTVDWMIGTIRAVTVKAPHPLTKEFIMEEMEPVEVLALFTMAMLHRFRNRPEPEAEESDDDPNS